MTDLPSLIQAAVENPKEDTPIHMLADYLLEKDDSRGDILHRWLQTRTLSPFKGFEDAWHLPSRIMYPSGPHKQIPYPVVHDDETLEGYGLQTEINSSAFDEPGFHLTLLTPEDSRTIGIRTSHPEARQIADSLPNSKDVHQFLDKHFGSDPRLVEGLNKALTDKSE